MPTGKVEVASNGDINLARLRVISPILSLRRHSGRSRSPNTDTRVPLNLSKLGSSSRKTGISSIVRAVSQSAHLNCATAIGVDGDVDVSIRSISPSFIEPKRPSPLSPKGVLPFKVLAF